MIFLRNFTYLENLSLKLKMNSLSRYYLVLFLIYLLIPKYSKAQEKPYYELPKNRKETSELLSMPNLKSFGIKYYFGVAGGFKKNYSSFEKEPTFEIGSNTGLSLYWEAVFGQNRDYNYFWEIGYINNPIYLKSNLNEINPGPFPLSFLNGQKFHAFPFRLKKRVLVIDKVSKSAFINLGLGLIYQLPSSKQSIENEIIKFRTGRNPLDDDITSIEYSLISKNKPISGELMIELRGKVIERFDLSIYLKSIYKPNKQLINSFNINYYDQSSNQSIQYLNNFSFLFGIQAQINSPNFLKYTSTVE